MATVDELMGVEVDDILVIDWDSRKIIIPSSVTNIGVSSDDKTKRLKFKMPRYYDDLDLSKFEIRVNYMNALMSGDMNKIKEDIAVSEEEIRFSWRVGRFAMVYKGDVRFNVCLKKIQGSGENAEVIEELNTEVTSLPVLEGLETLEQITQRYPDLVEVWQETLFGRFHGRVDDTLSIEGQAADAAITGKKFSDLVTELSKKASSAALAVERARIDQLLKSGTSASDSELIDIRVDVDGNAHNTAGTAVREQINSVRQCMPVELTDNLFNPNAIQSGYTVSSSGGSIYANESTFISEYIPVVGGESYGLFIEINGDITTLSAQSAAVYDGAKKYIGNVSFKYSSTAQDVTMPDNAEYLVLSISSTHEPVVSNIMLSIGNGELPDKIIAYKETRLLLGSDYVREGVLEKRLSELTTNIGCVWGAIGDSITSKSTLGESVKNYVDYVADSLGLVVENYGVNGTGFVHNSASGSDSYVNRLESTLSRNCDIVTIFGSFNDPQDTELQNKDILIGTARDTYESGTLCGAINRVIDIILSKNPYCKIIMFSSIPWGGYWNMYENEDAASKVERYNNAMESVAKYRGVMYKNLTIESNMRPWDTSFQGLYYPVGDTTHPNTYGHKEFIAPYVESAIREVLRKY